MSKMGRSWLDCTCKEKCEEYQIFRALQNMGWWLDYDIEECPDCKYNRSMPGDRPSTPDLILVKRSSVGTRIALEIKRILHIGSMTANIWETGVKRHIDEIAVLIYDEAYIQGINSQGIILDIIPDTRIKDSDVRLFAKALREEIDLSKLLARSEEYVWQNEKIVLRTSESNMAIGCNQFIYQRYSARRDGEVITLPAPTPIGEAAYWGGIDEDYDDVIDEIKRQLAKCHKKFETVSEGDRRVVVFLGNLSDHHQLSLVSDDDIGKIPSYRLERLKMRYNRLGLLHENIDEVVFVLGEISEGIVLFKK